jgi:hypothetical protein
MTKYQSFLRNYRYELVAFVIDIAVTLVAFIVTTQYIAFISALIIFLISTFVVIYFKTKDKDFYYYPFDIPGQEQDWVGRGDLKFIRNERCFEITNSYVGFILPKTSNWDDYRYELDFKITNISFGFIVRAVNLSNYVMHQIFLDYIKPHLRINGQWIIMDKITLENKLKSDIWYKLSVVCEKRNVRVQIKNINTIVFDQYIKIPSEIVVTKKELDTDGKEIHETRFMQNVDFDFGAVGVRNDRSERALIKNIFIEKL